MSLFLSVFFANITNRIYVFESVKGNVLKEGRLFFSEGSISGIDDIVLMFIHRVMVCSGFAFNIVIQVLL